MDLLPQSIDAAFAIDTMRTAHSNFRHTVAALHTKISGARRHPTGPNSFIFAYIFTKKCPRRRSVPL